MQKNTFALGALTAAMLVSFGTAQAAVNVDTSVGATHNLYYTGMAPKDLTVFPENPADAVGGEYTSQRMAMDAYPTAHPRGQCTVDPDTNLTCFGAVPVVVDVSTFDGTEAHVKASGTVAGLGPFGDNATQDVANGLNNKAIIGVFVKADSGSLDGVSYDGLADLAAYSNQVPSSLDTNTDGRLDNTFDVVAFRSHHPGFVEVGDEFQLVASGDVSGTDYITSHTIPDTATHLLLAYNVDKDGFDATVTDTFSVSVADNNNFSSTIVKPVLSVEAQNSEGTEVTSVYKGQSVTFVATGNPGTEGNVSGAPIDQNNGYTWSLNGTVDSSDTDNTYTPAAFTTAGNVTVNVTVTDTADVVSETRTVTVEVLDTVPSAGFSVSADPTAGSAVSFTDASTGVNGATITGWQWDFGVADATDDVSTEQNPSYTYAAAGTYTVSLTVTDSNGESSTAVTQDVVVKEVVTTTSGGGGGGAMSVLFGLGLLLPAFVRRRLK